MPERGRTYGVRERGKRWTARPYIPGVGHYWAGTHDSEDEALREAMRAFDRLSRLGPGQETVEGFARRWLDDYSRPKMSTNEHYAAMASLFVRDLGAKRLYDVNRLDARRFANGRPHAAQVARTMLADAMDEGLIEVNPFAKLRIPTSRGRKDIEVLSADELDRLLEIADSEHPTYPFREFLAFAAYAGMRPSEIAGLAWEDVDFDAAEIHVCRQLYRRRCTTPKNGRDRRIILPPPAADALRSLKRLTPIVMLDERERERPLDLVFRNKHGRALSQTALHNYWNPVRKAFGREDLEVYALRHFCATYLLEKFRAAGEDGAYDCAVQLGHNDQGELIRQTYGHPSEDLSRARLKGLFDPSPQPETPAGAGGSLRRLVVVPTEQA